MVARSKNKTLHSSILALRFDTKLKNRDTDIVMELRLDSACGRGQVYSGTNNTLSSDTGVHVRNILCTRPYDFLGSGTANVTKPYKV